MRGGFIIPAITLTPPDDKHRRSQSLPWQDFTSKSTLYVPVKTEEIGWEEGGLWWHGKFQYREVLLYGGEDDHVVGKYRGGPQGYAYQEIWDQEAFDHHVPRKIDEPAPQKPNAALKKDSSAKTSSASSSRTRSTSSDSTTSSYSSLPRRRSTSSESIVDSVSSSRRTSESTVDTTLTSPCDTPAELSGFSSPIKKSLDHDASVVESPIECGPGGAPFEKLEAALLALRAQKDASAFAESGAADTKAAQLQPGKSLTLSDDGPSATHRWPKGRGLAKVADTPASAASRVSSRGGASIHRFEREEDLGYSC